MERRAPHVPVRAVARFALETGEIVELRRRLFAGLAGFLNESGLAIAAAVLAEIDPGTDRPFIDPWHFILFLLLTAAGAVLGALTFRPKSGPVVPLLPLLAAPVANDLPVEGALP